VHLNNLLAARTKETTDNVLDVYHVLCVLILLASPACTWR
jgi:hypothetical protein